MNKIKNTDIKLHTDKDKLYVVYESVMKLVERHDLLIDKLREIENNA